MERPSATSLSVGRVVPGVDIAAPPMPPVLPPPPPDNAAVPGVLVEAVTGRLYPAPLPPPASPCGVGGTRRSLEEPPFLCGWRPPIGVDVPARRPMLVEAFGGGGRSPASGGMREGSALTSPSLASPSRVVQVVCRNTVGGYGKRRKVTMHCFSLSTYGRDHLPGHHSVGEARVLVRNGVGGRHAYSRDYNTPPPAQGYSRLPPPSGPRMLRLFYHLAGFLRGWLAPGSKAHVPRK